MTVDINDVVTEVVAETLSLENVVAGNEATDEVCDEAGSDSDGVTPAVGNVVKEELEAMDDSKDV